MVGEHVGSIVGDLVWKIETVEKTDRTPEGRMLEGPSEEGLVNTRGDPLGWTRAPGDDTMASK